MKYTLANPPLEERERELWMQHAAGFLVFENIRKYALKNIGSTHDPKTLELLEQAVDTTIYGMMMQMDGVFGGLENQQYRLELQSSIVLFNNEQPIVELNTLDGDGMCMGYHDWIENDYGDQKIVEDI